LTPEEVRNEFAAQLWKILELCQFPAASLVQASIAPEKVLLRFAGGKRTSSERQRSIARSSERWRVLAS
jgi:hypothetical protein